MRSVRYYKPSSRDGHYNSTQATVQQTSNWIDQIAQRPATDMVVKYARHHYHCLCYRDRLTERTHNFILVHYVADEQ